jgi:hypothetical protein
MICHKLRFPFSFYLSSTLFHVELSGNYNQKKVFFVFDMSHGGEYISPRHKGYHYMITINLSLITGDKTLCTSPSGLSEFHSICPHGWTPCDFRSVDAAEAFITRHFPSAPVYVSTSL